MLFMISYEPASCPSVGADQHGSHASVLQFELISRLRAKGLRFLRFLPDRVVVVAGSLNLPGVENWPFTHNIGAELYDVAVMKQQAKLALPSLEPAA